MSEVFGKKPLTSREFPVVLFDAMGTLMHFNPPLMRFYEDQFQFLNHPKSHAEIQQATARVLRKWNDASEQDPDFKVSNKKWLRDFLDELEITSDRETLEKEIEENFRKSVKRVLSQTVVDVCTTLQERGYRLGVVSNGDTGLAELFRLQGVLDLFEVIVTSVEAGHAKPHPEIFQVALDDLDEPASRAVYVGSSYATDVIGSKKAGIASILYDPEHKEMLALAPEDASGKVVSMETLRHNRRLGDVKIITRFSELLDILL